MQIIADLQLHSRFSRAVSPQMTIPNIALWARRKGIGLVATGDWTHPLWFREIERDLEELGNGLLKLKTDIKQQSQILNPSDQTISKLKIQKDNRNDPLFLLATEVSSIYKQGNKVRRIHTLLWVPSIVSARKISQEMTKRGCNLMSDGRPIIGLTSIQVAELVFSIEPKALIIPAHAWTPWFSVYGSLGGFDSIDEAFGQYAKNIYAIETGLSSNPSMNWRIKELDNRAILSFSDAHSGPKLGREATVFEFDGQLSDFSYQHVYEAISNKSLAVSQKNSNSSSLKAKSSKLKSTIAYTIEFYPEEGKYHYTGHRTCNIRQTPLETKKKGTGCPVCGKTLTVGVMHRVEDLAGQGEDDLGITKVSIPGLAMKGTGSKKFPNRPPFVMLVPLQEILHEAIGSPVASPKVQGPYMKMTDQLGDEFAILLKTPKAEIAAVAGERIAEGIEKVRTGNIVIDPGYDGVFGIVKIWKDGEEKPLIDASKAQLSIF